MDSKEINKFYKSDLSFKDFNSDELLHKISPILFNFVVFLTLSRRENSVVMNHPNLPRWLNGEIHLLETYKSDSKSSHRVLVQRVFLCVELMLISARGQLMNPLTLQISDLLNKHSGSVKLTQSLNNLGRVLANFIIRVFK